MAYKTPAFEKFVQDTMKESNVPGISFAVIQGDEIYSKAYGHSDLPDTETTTDTLFDLASTSKCTTAAAVALLVDDEKYPDVQWTTPVSKLLPDDFVLPDSYLTGNITIEDILSHRSGIATHDESYFSVRGENPDTAKSITRNLRNLEFVKPLRTKHLYSNRYTSSSFMFTVATHLVETVSGIPYAEFLRTKLWKPLGMNNTFHDVPDIQANSDGDKRSTCYHWDVATEKYITIPLYPPSPEGQGAGCIFSSAGDYAKFIRALIKRDPVLSEASHEAFATPRSFDMCDEKYAIPFESTELYSLGLSIINYRGHTMIGHNGSVPGFRAMVCYMPKHDWGLVIFGNSDMATYINDMLKYMLIDEVIGVREEDRIDWVEFFRKWRVRDDEEVGKKPDWATVESPEPLSVALDKVLGKYHNPGYKGLVLEMKDGELTADCKDRCFPFMLIFTHLTGDKFSVESYAVWDKYVYQTIHGEIRVEAGEVVAVGVGLEEDVEGGLIWFARVK